MAHKQKRHAECEEDESPPLDWITRRILKETNEIVEKLSPETREIFFKVRFMHPYDPKVLKKPNDR